MGNKLIVWAAVGILVLLGSKLTMEYIAPSSLSANEGIAYEYGGAILAAALALTYVVRRKAAA